MGRSLPSLLAAILVGVTSPGLSAELLVSAAASLTDAVSEVAVAFETAHPGTTVTCNFAGSGTLLRQLERGAPVDVLLTADRVTMDRAEEAGLLQPDTRTVFAGNVLVLAVPPEGAGAELTPVDLHRNAGLLLAVGNPKFVPAGRYARRALGDDLWARLEGRLVLGNSVRQVLDYLARGEVDAGVVYATDAAAGAGRVRAVADLPGREPIQYPAAVVSTSEFRALATRLIRFLCDAPGQAILARHGFTPPPAVAEAPATLAEADPVQ